MARLAPITAEDAGRLKDFFTRAGPDDADLGNGGESGVLDPASMLRIAQVGLPEFEIGLQALERDAANMLVTNLVVVDE